MEISQLRALLALKELSSLSRAAEHLHFSTPAVFNQIHQLEEQFSLKLYERAGRNLILTPAGLLLAQHARRIVEVHENALAQMKGYGSSPRESLRIGCGPHSGRRVVPPLIGALLLECPALDIRLTTGDDQRLLRDLRAGLLDAILLSLPVRDPELIEESLWEYELVFVIPPRKLKSWAAVRNLRDLEKRPFILYQRPVVVSDAIHILFSAGLFSPYTVMENDNPDSIRELVKLGTGYAILPSWAVAEDLRAHTLRVIPPQQRSTHSYGVIRRKNGSHPKALEAFLRTARQWQQWWPLAKAVSPMSH